MYGHTEWSSLKNYVIFPGTKQVVVTLTLLAEPRLLAQPVGWHLGVSFYASTSYQPDVGVTKTRKMSWDFAASRRSFWTTLCGSEKLHGSIESWKNWEENACNLSVRNVPAEDQVPLPSSVRNLGWGREAEAHMYLTNPAEACPGILHKS